MSLLHFSLILLNTLILVSGQFLWKFGMQTQSITLDVISILKVLFSPFVFTGLAMYGFATVLWLYILSKVPLSVAYPIQSLSYILAVFGAYFVFNESLSIYKIIGCLLILIGVSLIGFSPNSSS